MTAPESSKTVKMGFKAESLTLAIADIVPQRTVSVAVKRTSKYKQIVASIAEVGIVEPPMVCPHVADSGKYLLLSGHLRIEALKDLGRTEVVCLVSTDDEAFTYNRHYARIAPIQEHRMITKAIERGVPADRIAKTLNVDAASLRSRLRAIDSICAEAAELLKEKHVPINTFRVMRKMAPMRQIEAAERMIAMNFYATSFAEALLAATPQSDLVASAVPKRVRRLSSEQMAAMERESGNLDREYKTLEQSYTSDHLDLVLAVGYLGSLLANNRALRYLAQHHAELLAQFQLIVDAAQEAGLGSVAPVSGDASRADASATS